MKKLLSILLLTLSMAACTNQTNYELPIDEYPQAFFDQVNELPEEIQEKMIVPTEFPFKVEEPSYHKDETSDGKVILTALDYVSVAEEKTDKIVVHFTTSYLEALDNFDKNGAETIKLDSGIEAKIRKDNEDNKTIIWTKDNQAFHTLSILSRGEEITLVQLETIANSMTPISSSSN
ncbi:hypothetical protein ACQCVP_08090 [Rossellomorea vietnamensis]|uniref:hypothetical protein n=1 Tax=Rossellomorea vietnamensis TaxID=218284 RepID=UPI003CF379E1